MLSTTLGFKLTYLVRYLYLKLFFSPKKECFYGQRDTCLEECLSALLPTEYQGQLKPNLAGVSVWVESVSSSRNTGCRKLFWIPDMQDLFLLIHRGCHCLQQKKDFFSPRFVGISYARDCQPVVVVLNPKTSVQSLLFRKEEVQPVMLVSWSLAPWAHPLGTCSSGRSHASLEERISQILWALNGLVEILIKFLHATNTSLALLQCVRISVLALFCQSTMIFVYWGEDFTSLPCCPKCLYNTEDVVGMNVTY